MLLQVRVLALTLSTASGVLPAAAQTFGDAVRSNIGLGLEMCIRHLPQVANTRTALATAGFSYEAELFGNEVLHRYYAPSDTASVAVYEGQMAPDCRVESEHLGVTEAVAFVGTTLAQRFPGMFTYGNMENTAPITAKNMGGRWLDCTGYVGWAGQRPITVSVANMGNDPACVEDGTAQIVVTP